MGAYRWWVHGCPKCDDIRLCWTSSSDLEVIASRLGMQPRSVVKHLERHGEHRMVALLTNRWADA